MMYTASVLGAPASSVPNTPGCRSVGHFVTWSQPTALSIFIMKSQPSSMALFSAAMVGTLIQSSRIRTMPSCFFSISSKTGLRSAVVADLAAGESAAAAAPAMKVRRSIGMGFMMSQKRPPCDSSIAAR
jgi:hypothetical protein